MGSIIRTKFEKKLWYPNMREAETLIWERFLARFPDAYDEVAYNVKVGEGAEIPEGTDETIAFDFKVLTQRKIDVIGFKGNTIDIIELKPLAGTGAVGQVKAYGVLYKKTYDSGANPNLIVMTDAEQRDTKTVAEAEGVKLIII
jgi:hypothetical protein